MNDKWQPIKTAPKTGADLKAIEILGWIPDETDPRDGGDYEVVYWEPYQGGRGQWFCFGIPLMIEPTHWKPLPPPPRTRKK